MIGHERKDKWKYIQKTKYWRESADKQQPSSQRSTSFSPQYPERNKNSCRRRGKQPLSPVGGIDLPSRIDEDQIHGPHELSEVEPNSASGHEATFDECHLETGAFGADQRAFDPRS